ncbi:MAG: pyrrolo-quinoline quinone [Alphaproteobacteria bacterium]|jgi:outer membrane protein assembly factor BamB|nr:pyrrolo-quinoline quinone [Alphaproteobacteria bacterium]
MKRINKLTVLVLGVAFILSGCDAKDTTPLPGERESFIVLNQSLLPDPTIVQQSVIIANPVVNQNWSQVGGNTAHAMPPLAFADKPQKVWEVSMGYGSNDEQRLVAGIVVDQGVVYGMDSSGTVYAINAVSGESLWNQSTNPEDERAQPFGGGVSVDAGVLYAATSFGEVLAMDPKDGKILWRSSAMSPIRSAPTVKDGRVYIVTISNETYAFDAKTGATIWTHSGIVEQATLLGSASPAVVDNVVIVAYSSGEVTALQAENGHVLWADMLTSAVRIDTVSSIPHIRARPVVYDNQVIAISHGGRMTAIDLKSGVRQWQKEVGGVRTPAVSGDWVFILIEQGEVLCLHRQTGQVRWAANLPKLTKEDKKAIYWAGPVIVGSELVFCGTNGQAQFLSTADGKPTKTLEFDGESIFSAVVADKTLYVLTDQAQLYAWR